MLVLDDSVVRRSRSKAVELLARVYDHVGHKYQKGFTLLTLGWSDGYSFVPVELNLLSSVKKSNRYQEISDQADRCTNGYNARKESLLAGQENAGSQHHCTVPYRLPIVSSPPKTKVQLEILMLCMGYNFNRLHAKIQHKET